MGRLTSIYLTDEEAEKLKKFCDDNQCTQYSALKTAISELSARNSLALLGDAGQENHFQSNKLDV
ncbi:MAG: hypothetical protein OEY88_00190 [Candidatus Bathyarchaeota archaeon]|nr:hypothetical protein [Candidatus Bathyarchaeota archaeon]